MLFVTRRCIEYLVFISLGLIALLKFHMTITMLLSMLVSVLAYALPFGGWFAVGLVGLLFAHEFGHVMAARVVGIRASLPVFIPFLGALIHLQRPPVNVKMAANIAIGGPALGAVSVFLCLACYFWTDSVLLLALSYVACLLNLFNLIPCEPLDGGKIGEAISPHLWWLGSAVIGGLFFYTYNALILLIFFFSLHRLWPGAAAREPRYYQLTRGQRIKVLCWYVGLIAVLGGAALYVGSLL